MCRDILRVNMHLKHCHRLFLLMVLLIFFECMCVPQIYEEVLSVCQITLGNNTLQVPRKTWSVAINNETLHFSICESLLTKTLCRGLHTSSCLVSKTEDRRINTGSFISGSDKANRLHSKNGDKCPFHDGLYKVIINLECEFNTKIYPTLKLSDDSCTFELTMMKPDCDLKCARFIRGYFLDLRAFPKNLEVVHLNQKFKLTLCGTSNQCDPDSTVSSCEILKNGSTVPLAKVESQSLRFDVVKNILTLNGKYRASGVSRQIEVLVRCNWEIENSNVVYKKPPGNVGKKFKFELESSFGCVKLPPNCHVIRPDNNLHYDLSGLYQRDTGFWNINMPNGRAMLNICGPLKLKTRNSCSDQYSQVCEVQNDLNINRGSVLSHLEAEGDSLYGSFIYGSKCNSTTSHSTKIEFICFEQEEGPVFQKSEDCVTYLLWRTPKACPVNYYKGNDCIIYGRVGSINLQSLHVDNELILSPNAKLIYNLCGSVTQPCATFHNVSFCLKTQQGRDTVIGWENKELISDEGILKLDYEGSQCNTRSEYGRVNVVFVCNFEDPPPKPQIEVLSDNCRFKLKVFTHLACTTEKITKNCSFTSENTTYDLSPLVLRNDNYVVRANDGSIISLNLCGTVLSNTQALCYGDSMICMSKSDEPNFSKKFLSLGSVATPHLNKNSNLVIKAKGGSFCGEFSTYYNSVIEFECSTSEEGPKLSSVKQCVYYFLWKTRHVCRRKNNCLIPRGKRDYAKPDLNLLKEKSVNINNITTYTFHLCNETYRKCIKDECKFLFLKRQDLYENQSVVLTLNELESCNNNSITKVVYRFICDLEIKEATRQTIANCTLFESIGSHLFCEESDISRKPEYTDDPTKQILDRSDGVVSSSKEKYVIEETPRIISESANNNCSFRLGKQTLNLTAIGSAQEKVGDSTYYVDFNRSSTCKGIVCRNTEIIVPFQSNCPKVTYDSKANTGEIFFESRIACDQDFYRSKILFGCIKTPIIIKDENCLLAIQLNLRKICHGDESVYYIALGVGCLVISVFFVGLFYFKKTKVQQPSCCSTRNEHTILLSALEDKIK